ncbi:MAG TPA: NAD(P)H-quinone oxidoreductase, partial [Pyrinomonadaceae bacterium]
QLLGRYPAPHGYPQDIPGLEFAGEVESVGPDVGKWKIGQRVFGITAGGAQAEYVVVPENHLAEIPACLNWHEAAAVPEVFITAHDAVFTQAGLQLGETLLVHAAGSGVGTAAVQLAHTGGARVMGTSRTAEKLEQAGRLGLDQSLVVGDPALIAKAVREWTKERGVDVILDLVGANYFEANLNSLAAQGRIVLVGTTSGAQAPLNLSIAMSKRVTIIGTVLRARSNEEKATAVRLFAKQVVPLLASGIVKPVIDEVYPLQDVRQAYARLKSNESFGKVVLSFE